MHERHSRYRGERGRVGFGQAALLSHEARQLLQLRATESGIDVGQSVVESDLIVHV